MRTVEWSERARRQLGEWTAFLERKASSEVAKRAALETEAAATALGRFSGYRRSRRWDGFRELGLRDWHKLLVFQVEEDRVVISALFDQRQDLSAVSPFSK